ncbi:uncharacterized protein LOC126324485 [Schistocerca gregaria]|uniref:uncharacterized protein LOC126324485 n=1 Tax=Schistocerca gregaria TaxID=7010 RepID=UPI00211F1723|nr:uncharacterized protein LOC126324485 [Schistocerca gregaria]
MKYSLVGCDVNNVKQKQLLFNMNLFEQNKTITEKCLHSIYSDFYLLPDETTIIKDNDISIGAGGNGGIYCRNKRKNGEDMLDKCNVNGNLIITNSIVKITEHTVLDIKGSIEIIDSFVTIEYGSSIEGCIMKLKRTVITIERIAWLDSLDDSMILTKLRPSIFVLRLYSTSNSNILIRQKIYSIDPFFEDIYSSIGCMCLDSPSDDVPRPEEEEKLIDLSGNKNNQKSDLIFSSELTTSLEDWVNEIQKVNSKSEDENDSKSEDENDSKSEDENDSKSEDENDSKSEDENDSKSENSNDSKSEDTNNSEMKKEIYRNFNTWSLDDTLNKMRKMAISETATDGYISNCHSDGEGAKKIYCNICYNVKNNITINQQAFNSKNAEQLLFELKSIVRVQIYRFYKLYLEEGKLKKTLAYIYANKELFCGIAESDVSAINKYAEVVVDFDDKRLLNYADISEAILNTVKLGCSLLLLSDYLFGMYNPSSVIVAPVFSNFAEVQYLIDMIGFDDENSKKNTSYAYSNEYMPIRLVLVKSETLKLKPIYKILAYYTKNENIETAYHVIEGGKLMWEGICMRYTTNNISVDTYMIPLLFVMITTNILVVVFRFIPALKYKILSILAPDSYGKSSMYDN